MIAFLNNKQSIFISFLGDVVLTNLKIRDNALDDLDLPVQLVFGYLGKYKLNDLNINYINIYFICRQTGTENPLEEFIQSAGYC